MKYMRWKFILPVFIALAVGTACSQNAKKTEKKPAEKKTGELKKEKPAALAAGKKVYNTYCLTCHGQKGNMGASGAHDLTKTTLTFTESVKVITEGRGLMTPHKFLGKEKINAVAKYIETFKSK